MLEYQGMSALNCKIALIIFSLMSFISSSAHADTDVQRMKTRNDDLRGEKEVFRIKKLDSDQGVTLFLSGGNQHFISWGLQSREKLSSRLAREVDEVFVSDFIQIKYGTKEFTGKECKKAFFLAHRGEEQTVCEKDETRMAMVENVLSRIKKILTKRN